MTIKELEKIRYNYLSKYHTYKCIYYKKFKYKILNNILWKKNSRKQTYNDVIIMADTETSKKDGDNTNDNHVCLWTLSIRAYHLNIVTLYGTKPSEMMDCFVRLRTILKGHKIYIYFHNLIYDWCFLRKFYFAKFGYPQHQLNVKSHQPIYIEFENGIILRDSLILAQTSLDKWGQNMDVEHKKAVGFWDYDIIRNQDYVYSDDEIHYAEFDTLCGVECIDALLLQLNKNIDNIPYTSTGIVREACRKIGLANNAKETFNHIVPSYEDYIFLMDIYHGGFTHGNRHYYNWLIPEAVSCYDFSSSYPFTMLTEKFPSEKFSDIDFGYNDILEYADRYAFIFDFIAIDVKVKKDTPMPTIQASKLLDSVNIYCDNGRVLEADYIHIRLNEVDLQVLDYCYNFEKVILKNCKYAKKSYLPRWLTDFIFGLYKDKCMLKGSDPVQYSISKTKINGVYGMCSQKSIRPDITEDYTTGVFEEDTCYNPVEEYDKFCKKYNNILPIQWGIWVTSFGFKNLIMGLVPCADTAYYCDTDSCYGSGWDMGKLDDYNNSCKQKLKDNGYGAVIIDSKEYWLGVAEFEEEYAEYGYKYMGAKRYCCKRKDGLLKITVAGVPKKKGVKCLNSIDDFAPGFIFDGATTGKLTHEYINVDKIYIDKWGNETGDSINLYPCDYLLKGEERVYNDEEEFESFEIKYYE